MMRCAHPEAGGPLNSKMAWIWISGKLGSLFTESATRSNNKGKSELQIRSALFLAAESQISLAVNVYIIDR